jgi:hypothetical protein
MTGGRYDGAVCHVLVSEDPFQICGKPAVFRIAERKEPIAFELLTCNGHGRRAATRGAKMEPLD